MDFKKEDNSKVDKLFKVIKELENADIVVGVVGEDKDRSHDKGKMTVLGIAIINEFGLSIEVTPKMRAFLHHNGLHLKKDTTHINIPGRSFIRSSYDENKDDIAKNVRDALDKVINLKISTKTFFKIIGEACVGMIQDYMKKLSDPGNHPYTIEQKRSSSPLIDTGRLIDSITYEVRKK